MKDNQGSVIFVMFAAIALAAILSLTVMTRNQEYSMDAEEVSLVTSQALQIMSRTRESLQRFLLTKDLTLEQIDMHDPFFVAFSDTDSCTTDSCNLYSYSGGSASPPVLPPTVLSDLDISGCTSADDDGTLPHHLISSIEGVGSDLPEVLLYYCGISLPVCQRINIMHGVRGEGDAPVVATYGSSATNDYQYFAI